MVYRQMAIDAIENTIAAANSSSMLEHPVLRGRLREIVVEELIKPFLTPHIKAVTGAIIDVHGIQSNQVDVILYDEQVTPPILFSEGEGLIPCHSVVATIEIKSTLTKSHLRAAVENARSVKFLKYDYDRIPISGEVGPRLLFYNELIDLLPEGKRKDYFKRILFRVSSPACYAFAFTSDLALEGAIKDEASRLQEVVEESNIHKRVKVPISGLCVADRSFQHCITVDPSPQFEVELADDQRPSDESQSYWASHNVVLKFISHLVNACSVYANQRWRIHLDAYFNPPTNKGE